MNDRVFSLTEKFRLFFLSKFKEVDIGLILALKTSKNLRGSVKLDLRKAFLYQLGVIALFGCSIDPFAHTNNNTNIEYPCLLDNLFIKDAVYLEQAQIKKIIDLKVLWEGINIIYNNNL